MLEATRSSKLPVAQDIKCGDSRKSQKLCGFCSSFSRLLFMFVLDVLGGFECFWPLSLSIIHVAITVFDVWRAVRERETARARARERREERERERESEREREKERRREGEKERRRGRAIMDVCRFGTAWLCPYVHACSREWAETWRFLTEIWRTATS